LVKDEPRTLSFENFSAVTVGCLVVVTLGEDVVGEGLTGSPPVSPPLVIPNSPLKILPLLPFKAFNY